VSAARDPVPAGTPNLPAGGTDDPETPMVQTLDSLVPVPTAQLLVDRAGGAPLREATAQAQQQGTDLPAGRSALPRAAGHRIVTRDLTNARWPLLVVLAVQLALSLRLVWSNTAFQDEALYLRAGHLEWARWLHGTPIPDFPSYFSGAPVMYPAVGALADSIGGLATARMLSLCFMLGVTSLLWATARRLYGQRAALLAAALFATLAGTQFLGAFATFDAPALLLLALGAWLGVRSADCQVQVRIALLIAAGAALAVADAVKYTTALFTPVVLVVVALTAWRQRGAGAGVMAGATMLCSWLALILAAVVAGGRDYWTGITTSTLSRAPSDAAVTTVLQRSYVWTSLILVLAVIGVVLAARSETRGKALPAVLAIAALLAPAEQARLHTTTSLQKHVVFGAWFAAIAAGYAMARMSRVDPGRGWAAVMALPIAASTLFGSMGQAAALYEVWPNAAGVVSVLRSAVRDHPGHYLAEDYDIEAYYLRGEVPWQRWSSTYYFSYPATLPGAPSYRAAIAHHYFSLVILNFGDTLAADHEITADMRSSGGYYVLARAGRFTIWASRLPQAALQSGGSRAHD
jgi:4-amino-4-deoxy-L-arabinose transferase-like glycosyltransferase